MAATGTSVTTTTVASTSSTPSATSTTTPATTPATPLVATTPAKPTVATTPATPATATTTAPSASSSVDPVPQPRPPPRVATGNVHGKMSTPDIVETYWRKTVDWKNTVEERPALKDEVENYEPLGDLLTGEVSFPQVNVLLFGGVGAGKSSVFNTWNSVFRNKIFNVARSGSADHSLTTKLSKYPIMSTTNARPAPLKFRICDIRGLEPDHLMTKDNMRFILEGNIPDKFQLDPSGNISADMPGFKRHPKLDERIHCVAIIQDASIVDAMEDANPEVTRNIKEMQTVMNNLDVPQVVILTKVDSVSEETRDDVSKAYYSTKIKSCVGKVSEVLGIPRNSIFPMKNYECETECDANVDIMALLTLKGILNQCDAYLFNHYDTINGSYQVANKQ